MNAPPNPWMPITDPVQIAILGKFIEELGEATAATARCLIQGVYEREPTTNKLNGDWLLEEIADVLAGIDLVGQRYELSADLVEWRKARKLEHLRRWHDMIRGMEMQKFLPGDEL